MSDNIYCLYSDLFDATFCCNFLYVNYIDTLWAIYIVFFSLYIAM